MSRWLLVRHGETCWNAEGRLQGHTDVSLSQKGRDQAERLRERLASVTIDAAYSSDLARSRETATALAEGRNVPLVLSAHLREQCYGRWEGSTDSEIRAHDPEAYADMMVADDGFTPPQGESFRQVRERVASFAKEIRAEGPQGTLLIVGHSGSLKALLVYLLDLPPSASWCFRIDACGLSILDVRPETAVLELFNDTSHLGGQR